MKTFLKYIKKNIPSIGWIGMSHGEIRKKKKKLDESILKHLFSFSKEKKIINNALKEKGHNEVDGIHHKIHSDPDIKPLQLNDSHKKILKSFTSSSSYDPDDEDLPLNGKFSSQNLNHFLRNKKAHDNLSHPNKDFGFISDHPSFKDKRTEKDMEEAVELMSQLFTKENMIRKPLNTYGGIPLSIAKNIISHKQDYEFYLEGFTSTSTNINVAIEFAKKYDEDELMDDLLDDSYLENDMPLNKMLLPYIIHYKLPPESGISVASLSPFYENEIILKFGTKLKFEKTTEYDDFIVLHCQVFPINEALTIKDYGKYHHV